MFFILFIGIIPFILMLGDKMMILEDRNIIGWNTGLAIDTIVFSVLFLIWWCGLKMINKDKVK